MAIKITCDICGEEVKEEYTTGIGDYCNKCMKRVKDYSKRLKEEAAFNSTNAK